MSNIVKAAVETVHMAESIEDEAPHAASNDTAEETGATETRELTCDLSDEDVIERAKALAHALSEVNVLEVQRRASAKHFGEDIKALEREVEKLAVSIRTRQELREVECLEKREFRTNEVVVVRTDTGDVIDSRAMTIEERQECLFPRGREDSLEAC